MNEDVASNEDRAKYAEEARARVEAMDPEQAAFIEYTRKRAELEVRRYMEPSVRVTW